MPKFGTVFELYTDMGHFKFCKIATIFFILISSSVFAELFKDIPKAKKPASVTSEADTGQVDSAVQQGSAGATSAGQFLAEQNQPTTSKLDPDRSKKTSDIGTQSTLTGLTLQMAKEEGEINDETWALIGLGLKNALDQGLQAGGAPPSSSSPSSSSDSVAASPVPQYQPESSSDSSVGDTQALPELPTVQYTAPQQQVSEQQPSNEVITYGFTAPSLNPSNPNDQLQTAATTPKDQDSSGDNKLKMVEQSPQSISSSKGSTSVDNSNFKALVATTAAKRLMENLTKNAMDKHAKAVAAAIGKSTKKSEREVASTSASEQNGTPESVFNSLADQLKGLGVDYSTSTLSNISDLGGAARNVFYSTTANGKKIPYLESQGKTITMSQVDFGIGLFCILSVFSFLIWQVKRAHETAAQKTTIIIDPKLHYIDIQMIIRNGKPIAVLTQYAKLDKQIIKRGELLSGSIISASYLPPKIILDYGFDKNDNVEFLADGTWACVDKELHIAIHVFSKDLLDSPKAPQLV